MGVRGEEDDKSGDVVPFWNDHLKLCTDRDLQQLCTGIYGGILRDALEKIGGSNWRLIKRLPRFETYVQMTRDLMRIAGR